MSLRLPRTDIWDWDPTGVVVSAHKNHSIDDLTSLSNGYTLFVNGRPNYLFETQGKQFSILRKDQNNLQAHHLEKDELTITAFFSHHINLNGVYVTLASVNNGQPFSSELVNLSDSRYYQAIFKSIPHGRYKLLYGFSTMNS